MDNYGSMSAADINNSMGLTYAGAQNENLLNNIFGNFGQQTDYYSGMGAAYGRATGGFGDLSANPYLTPGGGSGGIGSDAARAPSQPGNQPGDNAYGVDPGTWGQMSAGDRSTFNRLMGVNGGGGAPANPSSSALLGYDPNNPFVGMSGTGGGIGSDAARAPSQYQNQDPVVDWNRYFTGAASTQQAAPAVYPSSPGSDIFSGMSAGDRATWQRTMEAAGQGEAARNALAQTMTGAPSNGPYPNLGYNPGMQNYFANPGMNSNQFQNQFGMGFPNAGTPSQYTGSPYTNTQGQTFQPNMPGGYAPQFDANTPGGALNPGDLNQFNMPQQYYGGG